MSVMMRMEGIDVAEADKITIEIGDEVKVGVKPAPYSVKIDSNGYVAGFGQGQGMMNAYYREAAQQMAMNRNENKS